MKDSGKVSLPTPERIEEIKQTADDSWFAADNSRGAEAHLRGEVFALCEGTNELLAALEEAEHKLGDTGNALEIKRMLLEKANYEAGRQRVFKESAERKLAEAQQTIARHETALNEIIAYSTDENAVDVASVSMGYVEGEKTDEQI
ncbi:hypothetical protein [Paenibacillus sp. FSL L8-0708]|uniref:hypothetical protein n=1 Tax=Paenibacillus sp. FSL L8-0708 TaxID=2975311 RepID=UPI0030F99A17